MADVIRSRVTQTAEMSSYTHPIAEGASSAIHPSQMPHAQGSNASLQFVSVHFTVHVSGLFARILFIGVYEGLCKAMHF